MSYIGATLSNLIHQTAFFNLTWGNYLMILVPAFSFILPFAMATNRCFWFPLRSACSW